MPNPAATVSIPEKLASGSLLHIRREFCPWIGISAVTAYKEVKAGRLKVTKIGHRTYVAAVDALAFRDAVIAASAEAA